ncbi:MAG: transcriptional repressor [Clostridia bacterium]|nr:transcriptional repressor [Clostridia bacterium]
MKKASYTTSARTQLLTLLQQNAERTVTAAELAAAVDANKTTVYRNLDRLAEEGAVMCYGDRTYQYVGEQPDCHGHLHLKCAVCGRVYHLDCGFMDEIRRHIAGAHHFALQCEGSVLYGRCENCQ